MAGGDHNIDVTKNVKTIEWMKSELLNSVAGLFELLMKGVKGSQDALVDLLANIILVTYILGKRLGVNFYTVDMRIEDKIKLGILEHHKVEDWYGDLSSLKQYMNRNRS
ncbi:MAG: MazG-like family protein [Bacillota bacterium]